MKLYPQLRALQSRFPALLSMKSGAQRLMRQAMKRPFERDFEVLARLKVRPGECAIDVGANRGQSIDAIRLYQPDLPVHSFEPSTLLADRLRQRYGNSAAITIHNCGLSERAEDRVLYLPVYRDFPYDGLASFDRKEAAGWLNAETVAGFDPSHLDIRETVCVTERLDAFDFAPAFLKIDVQGFEANVLKGGEEMLEKHNPLILLENNDAADAWLTGKGWRRLAYAGGRLQDGARGKSNTFYLSPRGPVRLTD